MVAEVLPGVGESPDGALRTQSGECGVGRSRPGPVGRESALTDGGLGRRDVRDVHDVRDARAADGGVGRTSHPTQPYPGDLLTSGGEASGGDLDAGAALVLIEDVLRRVRRDRSGLSARERLGLVSSGRRVSDMLTALVRTLLSEADEAGASLVAAGTPSTTWFAGDGNLTRGESAGEIFRSRALTRRAGVRDAALVGRITPGQAAAIGKVFEQLPESLSAAQMTQAEGVLLEMAAHSPAPELERAAGKVLAVVAPVDAAEQDAIRLRRQAELAHRRRGLTFSDDRQGSILIRGRLPVDDGQQLVALVHAQMESVRRCAVEARDRLAAEASLPQRQADALMALVRAHGKGAASVGGGRPRVVVTIRQKDLERGLAHAGRLPGGQQLSAGQFRRLACDAEILPVVLGGPSEILDVGRVRRLVTSAIRAALTQRDGGCVFPSCEAPATRCDAHHVRPWWAGGPTSLGNLVLLCPHHHGLVEPDRDGVRDQWEVRIAPDGVPEFVPPRRADPHRVPIRHHRFTQESQQERAQQDPDPPGPSP